MPGKNCVTYSTSSVAETRDSALSFIYKEVDFRRLSPVAILTNGVSLRSVQDSNSQPLRYEFER